MASLEKSDLTPIKRWRNEQRDVLRQNKILTDKDQVNWYALLQQDKKQKIFSIIGAKGELLGYCGITNIDWYNRRGEVSFLLRTGISKADYRKYFLDVLDQLKKYFFSILKLHKLFTETFEYRKFHISILEKFGFKRSGVLVDHIYKKGKYYDSLVHCLIDRSNRR